MYICVMMTTEQSLQKLFGKRGWYKDSGIKESTARVYKKRFLENKLEMETRIKILKACDFKLVQEMQWEEPFGQEILKGSLADKLHREHVFWAYHKSDTSPLPDDILIEMALLHLDIDDINTLFRIFPKGKIQAIWKEKMLSQEPFYHGLNRLYAFLFFGLRNPDRYIHDHVHKRYKAIQCKD